MHLFKVPDKKKKLVCANTIKKVTARLYNKF